MATLRGERTLSTAQSVLALMILNKKKQISKSQDRKPFQDFIADLTGLNHRNIGDIMARFNEENQYLPHKSKKKNLEGYQKLRVYFEKMENRDALDFADNQINTINYLKE